jgi:hypothetical protein
MTDGCCRPCDRAVHSQRVMLVFVLSDPAGGRGRDVEEATTVDGGGTQTAQEGEGRASEGLGETTEHREAVRLLLLRARSGSGRAVVDLVGNQIRYWQNYTELQGKLAAFQEEKEAVRVATDRAGEQLEVRSSLTAPRARTAHAFGTPI